MTREEAMSFVNKKDGLFPSMYAGVSINEVLGRIGMTRDEVMKIIDRFTNWSLFGEKLALVYT
jgi:hypothetical protein